MREASNTAVLSPQETRILREIKGNQSSQGPSQSRLRTAEILHSFNHKRPRIDVERAKYFTESLRSTEGEPLILRWSRALKHIAENITVYIDDHQLLVGRAGGPGKYGILYPELDGDFLDTALSELPSRRESPFSIRPGLSAAKFPLIGGGKPFTKIWPKPCRKKP